MQFWVEPSTIEQQDCALGVSPALLFGKGELAVSYCGLLVLAYFGPQDDARDYYGHVMKRSTVLEFEEWTNERGLEAGADGRKHTVYMVPETFSALRFINEPWYIPGDKYYGKRVIYGAVRKVNAVFVEADVGELSADSEI